MRNKVYFTKTTSKIRTLFLLLLLLPPLFAHAQEKIPHACPQPITVTNNPTMSPSPVFNTEIKPQFITNTTSTIHAIGIKIENIAIMITDLVKETINTKNYDLVKQCIKELLWQHRYTIAGGTIVGSYSATSLLLLADYHRIDNTIFWPRWKRDCTFEDLCAIPQKELAKELLLAIGQHHYNKTNPTDLAYPLVTFIKSIDEEINTIKRYITTSKTIKRLRLMPIFPTNENKLNQAVRLLERTLFIKHIFLSWLADYNLTSTEKLNA